MHFDRQSYRSPALAFAPNVIRRLDEFAQRDRFLIVICFHATRLNIVTRLEHQVALEKLIKRATRAIPAHFATALASGIARS